MQPDRPCYVRRAADDELLDAIASQRFACVLAPRAMGKSSLMARTIRRLRADGQAAAVIDFDQIAPRAGQVDSARWHYSIAYRICRELRLRVDLQSWWHDKNLLLSEQRLVEFFWDVVLANTDAPVTIFFDAAERAVNLPFAAELFVALQGCYLRRVSEPDFARLNFVVLGTATHDELCPDPGASPFVGGCAIELADFTLAQCAAFVPGLTQAGTDADALLTRIYYWTHGQPYLTQKLARGIARRGGRPADVDSVAQDLFLAPRVSREEPLLHHMRSVLTASSSRRRRMAEIVSRLARGLEVIYDPGSPAQRRLYLAGIVSSDENGMLRFRNRLVEQVFGTDPAFRAGPDRWLRPVAIGAAAIAAAAALPYWYTQVLPDRAIATLESETEFALLEQAHEWLGRWPGFGGVSDDLFSAAMARRSDAAVTLEEAMSADAALRSLPDGDARADPLMAAFWLRRAREAAARGDRDGALVRALVAAKGQSREASAFAAGLIGGDYLGLERSIRLESPARAAEVDWERDQLVVVDAMHRVHRWPLSEGGPAQAARTLPVPLTALEQVGVTRGLFVDEPGTAGTIELGLILEHARVSDLLVRLTAPSGAAAEIELPGRSGRIERFVINASSDNGLMSLADESITGTWEVTLFDRLAGESGRLISWSLRFSDVPQNWDDAPVNGLPLPDPVRTGQVGVSLAPGGRLAAAIPTRIDARGAASVWDLTTGERIADLPLADRNEGVALLGDGRVLVHGSRHATLWDVRLGAIVVEQSSRRGFLGQPAVSPDGSHFALAEPAGDAALVSVYRARDGVRIGRFETGVWRDWALADGAGYIAGIDGSRRGVVLDPTSGEAVAEFFHERDLARVVPGVPSDRVVGVDRDGGVFAWPLTRASGTLTSRDSVFLGTTSDPGSVVAAGRDGAVAFADIEGFVSVVSSGDGRHRGHYEHGADGRLSARLAPEGDRLVTVSTSRARIWRLAEATDAIPVGGEVSAVALDASGQTGVLGYRSGEVALLRGPVASLQAASVAAAVTGHRGVVTSLAVNDSGALAASGGSDGVVRVWDTKSGERVPFVLRHPAGPIGALAFSHDDRWLVSAGPGSVRVFALADGALVNEIHVDGRPLAVTIDPANRLVAVGDSSGNVFLAAADGSAGQFTFRGASPITALRFADEPGVLASGSAAGDLVFWDTLTVAASGAARHFAGPIRWIAFAPDSSRLHLQSGSWLHSLDRRGDATRVVASVLMPERLRVAPALVLSRDGASVSALARAGGRSLAFGIVGLGAAPQEFDISSAPEAGVLLPQRDWRRVLGIELDTASGEIRRIAP